MLRGCRWQAALFLLAGLLLGIALYWRSAGSGGAAPIPEARAAAPTAAATRVPPIATVVAQAVDAPTVPLFREGLVGPLRHLNPLLAQAGSVEAEVSALIFEGLTSLNAWGEPAPALAEGWIIAAGGLEYVVTLRDDVLWQDGVPFSAADVMFTLSLLQAPAFPGDAELAQFWRSVEVEVLAANVLRFRLSQPLGSFPDRLRFPVLPWHALQGTPPERLAEHPFNWTPVGTGAWQLEALRRAEDGALAQVDLRPAPNWHGREGTPEPAAGRLRFQIFASAGEALTALQAGVIDGLAARTWSEREPLLRLAEEMPLHLLHTTGQGLGILIFNWQREEVSFFRDQRVRLALAGSIDRSAVVEGNLAGRAVVANSPLWPGSWAWRADLEWPQEDLDAARWLLGTARARDDDTPLKFRVLTTQDPQLVSLMEAVATQWSRVDVEVEVETRGNAAYLRALREGDFDAALIEIAAGNSTDPDVYAFWHEGQYPAGLNLGGVDDRRISELLEHARQEPWSVNRAALYAEMQQTFAERVIAIPLYYPLETYATARGFEGMQPGRAGIRSNRFAALAGAR